MTFIRPYGVVSIDGPVGDVKKSFRGNLRAKKNIIFVLEVIIDIISTIWIDYRINEVEGKVEAIVIRCE